MAPPSASRPKARMAALLVLVVAVAVQARLPLRQLLQTQPPNWTPPTAVPMSVFLQKPFNLTQPLYGPCSAVSAATGRPMSGGGYSGTMQCAGFDTVYYVGDEPGTDGRTMACYSSGGSRCGPGQAGCECVYPRPTNTQKWMCWDTGNWWWPRDCGFRETYVAWEGGGPGAGMCLMCPPRPRLATLNKPVVGTCGDVYKGNFGGSSPPLTAGNKTGAVSCAGYPGVFYVGDNSDNGKSWACYNNGGMPCAPGDGSCPCQYVNSSVAPAAPTGTGAGQCVICPALPTVAEDQPPPLEPCNNALGCGPWAPGIYYGTCDNVNFQKTTAGNFSRLASYGTPASGPVACIGQPGVYYASAIPNTNNQRLACFNYAGVACSPGSPGCPCDYLQTYDTAGVQFASASVIRGAYQCLVCPPITNATVVNVPLVPAPPPPPVQQSVEAGACSQVFANLFSNTPPPFTPGGWTGLVSCTTDPLRSTYWVGDALDSGASLACFNAYGGKCKANTTGCPCQILKTYTNNGATTYATANTSNTGGTCVVCPPAPVTTPSSTPPGVIYQPCGSSNFAAAGVAKPLPNSGTFTGQAYCASVPNSPAFWVGDNNDNGASLACFNYQGVPCTPGSAGCPCLWGTPNANGQFAWPSSNPGSGMCLVCPPMPRVMGVPPPQATLPPAPQAPATANPPRPPPPSPPSPPPPPPPRPPPPTPPPPCVDTGGSECLGTNAKDKCTFPNPYVLYQSQTDTYRSRCQRLCGVC